MQPGVAGPFAGTHGGALIVAGGANFPGKMPWEGGTKVWRDEIWVLEKTKTGPRWVTEKTFRLPRPLGYGVSVSTPEGVVCAGGNDANRCSADVFLLSWDPAAREIRRKSLPSLPQPLALMAGALVGHTLFVAGGQHGTQSTEASSAFWALDLSQADRPQAFKWTTLPSWPGPPRLVPVAAAQRTADGEAFFLFSGRSPQAGKRTDVLRDAYAFDPKTRLWRTLAPIQGGSGVSAMAAPAAAAGDEILLFGGDRGDVFDELEAHDLAIEELKRALPTTPAERRAAVERQINERLRAKAAIYHQHPGFGREVLAYDPRHDAWRVVARAPFPIPVTTTAVAWGETVVLPCGEIRPGVRTPKVLRATPVLK